MNPRLGQNLSIRSMVYVAGEPVPYFWPMRAFIHHNPLHGFEHLPFDEAVAKGADLFHATGFLPRHLCQDYLADGRLDKDALTRQIDAFVAAQIRENPDSEQHGREQQIVAALAKTLLSTIPAPITGQSTHAEPQQLHAAFHGEKVAKGGEVSPALVKDYLHEKLLGETPLYEAIDALYGTRIGAEVDEQVVRACLDFFDEGQCVWGMPEREKGFFAAWRGVADGKIKRLLNRIESETAALTHEKHTELSPEDVIAHIMRAMGVPQNHWTGLFTRELARLHGWTGFIRWRSNAKHYYWADNFPGDLVEMLAIRLTLAWMLICKRAGWRRPKTIEALKGLIEDRPLETWLRLELHKGGILPAQINKIDKVLATGSRATIEKTFHRYIAKKQIADAQELAGKLQQLVDKAQLREKGLREKGLPEELQEEELQEKGLQEEGLREEINQLDAAGLTALVTQLKTIESDEGMIWLRAMESGSMQHLMTNISKTPAPESPQDKRPFVQAAFCIDTRSERIRRHLESVGDYQTFGIAGFFGVPVSFLELGKGNEAHLCPVLLTPNNLVLEMSAAEWRDKAAFSTLEHLVHDLKETVFSPFVTVEAIGLLFGFHMVGKTLTPQIYNHWQQNLHDPKPDTHLMLDKLSREQADSIMRTVQRSVIIEAVRQELGKPRQDITDDIVRNLRETAMGKAELEADLHHRLNCRQDQLTPLVETLRKRYRIDPAFTQFQMEQLGRIGFSLDEQVTFVHQALSSIGLTDNFSRFVLLVGHGSTSENNPYESALDCGACGGAHGLVNARVLAAMANKPTVRVRLAKKGLVIPDDAWFMPALHNTTTDEIRLHDLELLPSSHLVYLDRLRSGLISAARLCAQERLPSLNMTQKMIDPASAFRGTTRNSMDWSQVRPEWGLSQNAYFIIGRRDMTEEMPLDGRAFLHSYDYRIDHKARLLENILTGPLVVAQWINMEHYFSAVDNEKFGAGSKVYHNVAGRFGVMTGNLSDLRTGLPAQTVLDQARPYHQPLRLMTLIEAPFDMARMAIENVATVKQLVRNGWVRMMIQDPTTGLTHLFNETEWVVYETHTTATPAPVHPNEEALT